MGQRAIRNWISRHSYHSVEPTVKNKKLQNRVYRKAIHGGKAKNDTIDSQKIAVLLRGGILPQASGYPAAMRATRDLLRRRTHLMRTRAELLAHILYMRR